MCVIQSVSPLIEGKGHPLDELLLHGGIAVEREANLARIEILPMRHSLCSISSVLVTNVGHRPLNSSAVGVRCFATALKR